MVSNVSIAPCYLLQRHWPSRAVSGMLFGLRAFALVPSWEALPPSYLHSHTLLLPSGLTGGPIEMVPPAGCPARGLPYRFMQEQPPSPWHPSLSLFPASSYQKGGGYK